MSLLTHERPSAPPPASAPVAPPPARRARARWELPALLVLLVATGVLYVWGLSASGYANSFYSAAVQAGSVSWKAMFFGSSDAANSITVDKTPLALWPMDLSVRIFGLSSWSILVPQAVEGVATVGLLFATVRRATGSAGAGLLAGLVLATTPVAALMFRFNNPDAMLVLLLTGSVYAILRAVESSRLLARDLKAHPLRWVALAGALVGLAFLAKMLQAFLVIPALGLVYLICAQTPIGKRIGHLLVGLVTMVAAAGWWVAIVSLWPAGSRPYIGGSQDNSILELTLGYNGFGRLTGDETGSVGGGGQGGSSGMWGATGITRLFGSEVGGQVAWLLPAALVLLVAGLWLTRRAARTDAVRASLIAWGAWLLVTGLTFSFMAGIFHSYYTVALAPAIGALVGTGAWLLWTHRSSATAAALAALTTALTSVFGFVLLGRSDDFLPWLRWAVLIVGLVAAIAIAGVGLLPRRAAALVAAAALITGLAGPTAYAVQTAGTGHSGSIPTAGPTTSGGFGFGGRPGGLARAFGGGFGATTGQTPGGQTQGGQTQGGQTQGGQTQGGQTQGGQGGQTQGGQGGGTTGRAGGTGGGMGSLLDGSTSTAAITKLLQTNAGEYTWVAAAVGSNTASGYQLASGDPVMPVGGFNGSDPSPTLAQFEADVAAQKIHYFIGGSSSFGGQMGGSDDAREIADWVAANFSSTTVDGVTLYDLSGQTTSGTASSSATSA